MRALVFCAVVAAMQAQTVLDSNPRTSPEDVAAGGRIFRSHCSYCHGLHGEGGRGPDLTRGEFHHGSSDSSLHRTVSFGVAGTEMPGTFFSENQVWQVVAYVRTLSQGGRRQAPPGDPTRGRRSFLARGCNACHRINGEGGRLGPDLSVIGSKRNPAHLRTSILKPSEHIAFFPHFEAKTSSGKPESGILLNEDAYSIQFLDGAENLRTLEKSQLVSLGIRKDVSSMPSFEGKIPDAELGDLIAYLYFLERRARPE
jgi:cytochrome c oxidase cbb3-type subunit III